MGKDAVLVLAVVVVGLAVATTGCLEGLLTGHLYQRLDNSCLIVMSLINRFILDVFY